MKSVLRFLKYAAIVLIIGFSFYQYSIQQQKQQERIKAEETAKREQQQAALTKFIFENQATYSWVEGLASKEINDWNWDGPSTLDMQQAWENQTIFFPGCLTDIKRLDETGYHMEIAYSGFHWSSRDFLGLSGDSLGLVLTADKNLVDEFFDQNPKMKKRETGLFCDESTVGVITEISKVQSQRLLTDGYENKMFIGEGILKNIAILSE